MIDKKFAVLLLILLLTSNINASPYLGFRFGPNPWLVPKPVDNYGYQKQNIINSRIPFGFIHPKVVVTRSLLSYQ
ncbi:Hypothetical protein SRAE_2000127500 [Strongyloides ratti]|uniref:Uncharacterized protein n=1 Tax=Strongyloides ratti TaxID=34506 RepID=A0A090LA43_STRRB|nr:Hypothetical protein SRAE_2000127500 [Strongyloides ratti]CEF66607.1 Hypothetical protein SRAE_2000127500 [Strongyloides ratti]